MFRWGGWLLVTTLVAAAAYELLLALRHTPSPSEGGALLLLGLVAMVLAAGLLFSRVSPGRFFAPAAALFVAARFYTGDPYYGSTFRRYADGGIFPPTWIYVLIGFAVAAGLTTHVWRRTFPIESAIALVLLIFTALFMGTGH
jgi:hypothetical protein